MSVEQTILLAIFACTMTFTPGPANLILLGTSMKHGVRQTLSMLVGVVFGFWLVATLIALGLGEVFNLYPVTLDIIRVLGTVYLLYLSYKIYESRYGEIKGKETDRPRFKRGLIVHPLNPKAWMMLASGYAQFVNPDLPIFTQSLTVIIVFVFAGAAANITWMLGGGFLQRYLHNAKIIYWIFTFLAVSLVVLIITIWL